MGCIPRYSDRQCFRWLHRVLLTKPTPSHMNQSDVSIVTDSSPNSLIDELQFHTMPSEIQGGVQWVWEALPTRQTPWALEVIGASHYHGNWVILSGISAISHSYLGTDHLPSLHVANYKQSLHLFIYLIL